MNTMLTLHDPQTARENYLSGIWQQDTLYTLAREHARQRPTSVALRDAYTRLSWREVLDQVDRVAETLHRSGLKRGDRVAIWLSNRVESVVIFLACSRNGYVCCPSLHQNYTVDEVVGLLDRIHCRALFTEPGYGADAAQHNLFDRTSEVVTLRHVFALPRVGEPRLPALPDHVLPYPDSAQPMAAMTPADLNPDKIVYLAFTSGTTGRPKGVMHSDNTLLANGRALVADWRHTNDTIVLTLSPMSHHIGTVALEQMLVAGMELVIHNPMARRSALEWVLETGATYVMGVPTHAMDILEHMQQRGMQSLGHVRAFYMAGSTIPQEVARKFVNLGITPQNVYGMTENGSHQYTLPTDSGSTIVSTCGRACHGYEIRLWNQEDPDTEVAVGEVGEIGGKGGVLMLGYYDDQDATEASFNRWGWFMSGDLGVLDENGCLQVVGRKKDLIIRGGHNIHPARIEDLAHRHPAVTRAAAFAVADERLGEKVCLAIITQPDTGISADEVLAHLHASGLSRYDMPEYFLAMAAFPLTASGKILKRELRDWVAEGKIVPAAVRFTLSAADIPASPVTPPASLSERISP